MTTTRDGNTVRYGKINTEMVGRWLKMDASEDGPFWALNLMKYREVADYGDGGDAGRSGREADDEYAPIDSLKAIGAQIVFAAEVEKMLVDDGTSWDRVAIVRYPSRRKFFEMQQRDDFKSKHVHKDAGMEFTIVVSCLPRRPYDGPSESHPFVELRVSPSDIEKAPGVGLLDVEGVIIGDERKWKTAAFRRIPEAPRAAMAESSTSDYVLLLRPTIDRLAQTVSEMDGMSA